MAHTFYKTQLQSVSLSLIWLPWHRPWLPWIMLMAITLWSSHTELLAPLNRHSLCLPSGLGTSFSLCLEFTYLPLPMADSFLCFRAWHSFLSSWFALITLPKVDPWIPLVVIILLILLFIKQAQTLHSSMFMCSLLYPGNLVAGVAPSPLSVTTGLSDPCIASCSRKGVWVRRSCRCCAISFCCGETGREKP